MDEKPNDEMETIKIVIAALPAKTARAYMRRHLKLLEQKLELLKEENKFMTDLKEEHEKKK